MVFRGCRRCAKAAQWRISQSLSVRRRTIAHAAVHSAKAGLLPGSLLSSTLPVRTLARQLIAAVGHTSYAAAAEDAAAKIELPRQLIGRRSVSTRQRVRRAGINAGGAADALLRIMFPAEVLSAAIGSSG